MNTLEEPKYDKPVLTKKALMLVSRDKKKQEQAVKDYGLDLPPVFFSHTDHTTRYHSAGTAFITCQNYTGNNEY